MNTRKVPRVPVFKLAFVDDVSSKARHVVGAPATVSSLGAMGCGFRSSELFIPGTLVRITFFDDHDDHPLSVRGRIVYTNSEKRTECFTYGVEFTDIDAGRENPTHSMLNLILSSTGYRLLSSPTILARAR